ncbi:hypothetical protein F4823DRAFT_387357 [Ustulina deusta]|nr:hypothetical protein F4823DRAFT_387357 [Ustulina deusta]
MENSAETWNNVLSDLHDKIEHRLGRKDQLKLRFATKNVAHHVLQSENLKRFFRCLCTNTNVRESNFGIDEQLFVDRVCERKLQPFIATLIFADCGIAAAKAFVTNVVDKDVAVNCELPLGGFQLKEIFDGDIKTVDNFLLHQGCFSTLIIRQGDNITLDANNPRRLPYLEETLLTEEGAFGRVWKVEIAEGHFAYSADGGALSFPEGSKVVARKDYIRQSHAQVDFRKERDIFKEILSSTISSKNVLLSFGSIENESASSFSVLMPLAESDLGQYMKQQLQAPDTSAEKLRELIFCAAGLARGVAHLHDGIIPPNSQKLVCYHMDLKPNNVLIFRENGEMIWKVSDFGLSRIKQHHNEVKTSGILTASATKNPAGQGTYLAPESLLPRSMAKKSDVWSIGCILSVLFVCIRQGYEGVQEYAKARTDEDDDPRFFIQKSLDKSKLKPQVKKWHKKLKREATDEAVKKTLKNILKYVEEDTLHITESKRPEARQLSIFLQEAAEKLQGPSDQQRSRSIVPIPKWRYYSNLCPIREWRIPLEQVEGCQLSPKGRLLCYYSAPQKTTDLSEEHKVALYYGGPGFPPGGLLVESALHHCAARISCIGLTWNYMVIAAKKDHFYFSLIDFVGSQSNGPHFEKMTSIEWKTRPSIHLIAISPSSRWVACIVNRDITRSHPVRLYLAKIQHLKDSPNGINQSQEQIWKHVDIDWVDDATNIISLNFLSKTSIWLSARPTHTSPARIVLAQIEEENELSIELSQVHFDKPHEHDMTKNPLTCFAPFHGSNKCLIVTFGGLITIRNFSPTPDSPSTDRMSLKGEEGIDIVKVLISRDDSRYLALARPRNIYGELHLVELFLESHSVRVKMKTRLKTQYLEHSLHKVQIRWLEEENSPEDGRASTQKSRVLIVALVKANENAVFEVEL